MWSFDQNIFLRHTWSSSTVPKMLQRHKGEMGVLIKVTFVPHPSMSLVARRTNHVIRGLGLSALSLSHLKGGQSWKLNQLMANDLIMPMQRCLHENPKGPGLESFHVGEHVVMWREWHTGEGMEVPCLFPMHIFIWQLICILYPILLQTGKGKCFSECYELL